MTEPALNQDTSNSNQGVIIFKLIVENKLFDVNGTPLPPSYPNSLFRINHANLRIDWAALSEREKVKFEDKILKTRLRNWRSKQVKLNTKKNGVGLLQGWCEYLD